MDKNEFLEKLNAYVLKFLHKNKFITKKDNVYECEKAFITASLLREFLEKKKKQEITDEQLNAYYKILAQFQDNKITLKRENGIITYLDLKKGE
jgi:hypothetical protein